MKLRKTRIATILVALVAMMALVAPQMAAAKTYKFTGKTAAKANGTQLTGKVTSKLFGKCTLTGTVDFSTSATKQKWKCKGGSMTYSGVLKLTTGTKGKGKFKLSGGTGKYKGIKGSGVSSGDEIAGTFAHKGTVSY